MYACPCLLISYTIKPQPQIPRPLWGSPVLIAFPLQRHAFAHGFGMRLFRVLVWGSRVSGFDPALGLGISGFRAVRLRTHTYLSVWVLFFFFFFFFFFVLSKFSK